MEKPKRMTYHEDIYMDVGKTFHINNLKKILRISEFMVLDMEYVSTKRVEIDNFPYSTKLDPLEVLMEYMISCLEGGIEPMVNIHNMLDVPPYRLLKRKRMSKKYGE